MSNFWLRAVCLRCLHPQLSQTLRDSLETPSRKVPPVLQGDWTVKRFCFEVPLTLEYGMQLWTACN